VIGRLTTLQSKACKQLKTCERRFSLSYSLEIVRVVRDFSPGAFVHITQAFCKKDHALPRLIEETFISIRRICNQTVILGELSILVVQDPIETWQLSRFATLFLNPSLRDSEVAYKISQEARPRLLTATSVIASRPSRKRYFASSLGLRLKTSCVGNLVEAMAQSSKTLPAMRTPVSHRLLAQAKHQPFTLRCQG
jgi:hypothetical protein